VPVFDGVAGADLQASLENPLQQTAVGGEYTDATGELHVQWNGDWSKLEHNEDGVIITNSQDSVRLYVQTYLLDGLTIQEDGEQWLATHRDDQGANGVVIASESSDTGFWYATNGDYGVRLGEGVQTPDPNRMTMVFAADIAVDEADPVALFESVNAGVLVNNAVPFPSLEKFIEATQA
jgi:hypothetical protein